MKRFMTGLILMVGLIVSTASTIEAADPGEKIPGFGVGSSQISDQLAGFMLVYNYYTSSATSPTTQNTRFSMTNTSSFGAAVHVFFVDGGTCSVSDRYICLSGNQTISFLASEQDPATTGYLVALSVDSRGFPVPLDNLIGEAYVKTDVGFFGNLAAEAIPARLAYRLLVPQGDESYFAMTITGLPRVLAVDNINSRADGNETLVVINGVGGDLRVSGFAIGTLFGILYDDAERPHSWSRSGVCQLVLPLNNDFPKTVPRFDTVIPAGQTGWMKFWSTSTFNNSLVGGTSADGRALLGAVFQRNPQGGTASGAFQGARNLHVMTVLSDREAPGTPQVTVFLIPAFPPNCGFGISVD